MFKGEKALAQHLRVHSGSRPFKCDHQGCDKTFKQKGHLVEHIRIHTGEKPYKCEICGQRFMRSNTYCVHLKKHKSSTPFPCTAPGCSRHYTERGNLVKHMKQKHPGHPLPYFKQERSNPPQKDLAMEPQKEPELTLPKELSQPLMMSYYKLKEKYCLPELTLAGDNSWQPSV